MMKIGLLGCGNIGHIIAEHATGFTITAVYDVVRDRPGRLLDGAVHELIAAARRGMDAELAARVRDGRLRAEGLIAKPVMKGFKALLGAAMPRSEVAS